MSRRGIGSLIRDNRAQAYRNNKRIIMGVVAEVLRTRIALGIFPARIRIKFAIWGSDSRKS